MINKEIYKYTSIISFTIMIIMILNLVVPMFSIANENEFFGIDNIEYNKEEKTITGTITIPQEYVNKNLVYWCKGEIPYQKPAEGASQEELNVYAEKMKEWCMNNAIEDVATMETTKKVYKLEAKESGKYNLIVILGDIALGSDFSGNILRGTCTITSAQSSILIEKPNVDVNTNTITAKVKSSGSNIQLIKIAKSDKELNEEYFKNEGEKVLFEGSTETTVSKTVDSEGTYYIYAQTEDGVSTIASATIEKKVNNIEKEISVIVEKYRKTNQNQTLYLKITSESGKIKVIKYYITNKELQISNNADDRNVIKNNGNDIQVSSGNVEVATILNSSLNEDKIIYMYVQTEEGEFWNKLEKYSNIQIVDSIPWMVVNDNVEVEDFDKKEEATGDKKEETTGDKKEEAAGDKKEEATGDKKEETTGDKKEEAAGDKKEEATGDKKEEATGDKKEEAAGDKKEEAAGDKKEEAAGDKKEEAAGDKKEEVAGDKKEEVAGNKKEESGRIPVVEEKNEQKENEIKIENIVNEGMANTKLPQTGSNDAFAKYAILIFFAIGIVSFVKYKKIK